jgi:murein tripeptide amidase MpaA
MQWFGDHSHDPDIAALLKRAEIWFVPVKNPDGYDFTFTCGTGATNHLCGAGEASSNRLWRKTLRDNDGNGVLRQQAQTASIPTATTRAAGTRTRRARATGRTSET